MKENGIIRHMDDLGRVVIPRKIIDTFNLWEDDRIAFFVKDDGTIILKPYNPKLPIYAAIKQLSEEVSSASIPKETQSAILKHVSSIRSIVENEIK